MYKPNMFKGTQKRQFHKCLLVNTEYYCVQILRVRLWKWFNNYNFLKYLYIHKILLKAYEKEEAYEAQST